MSLGSKIPSALLGCRSGVLRVYIRVRAILVGPIDLKRKAHCLATGILEGVGCLKILKD